jgi:tetratricopeptide (TPR) repeat protein
MKPIYAPLGKALAILLLTCATVAASDGAKRPAEAQELLEKAQAPEGLEQGVIQDGRPAVEVSGPFYDSCLVTFTRLASTGEPAFSFHVTINKREGVPGTLFITASGLAYTPDQPKYSALAFSASRSSVTDFNASSTSHMGYPVVSLPVVSLKVQGENYAFYYCTVSSHDDPKGTPKAAREQHARQADQANQDFSGWLALAVSNFAAAEAKFRSLTADASVQLSWEQQTTLSSEESAGDSAAQAGKLYDALQDYEAALSVLPEQWAPRDVEQRLEEKAIRLVQRMNPQPAIPQDAMQHMAYAQAAFQEAKSPGDLDNAIQELTHVLRLAPWWGDAYKNLSLLDEKAERYADAAHNLQLYLLATPNSPDAQSVQMKIYSLQYKAKQQDASN